MNKLLSSVCLLFLLAILALPLALIITQCLADAALRRKHKAVLANATGRELNSFFQSRG